MCIDGNSCKSYRSTFTHLINSVELGVQAQFQDWLVVACIIGEIFIKQQQQAHETMEAVPKCYGANTDSAPNLPLPSSFLVPFVEYYVTHTPAPFPKPPPFSRI